MWKALPQRKSPRWKGYDYTHSGAYFVTICAYKRLHVFGEIHDGEMIHNRVGEIVIEQWFSLVDHYQGIDLDAFIVMPNHVHGIVILPDAADESAVSLSGVVGTYKSGVTRRVRVALDDAEFRVWQTSFHDHVIRNEASLNRIREYVANNPARWAEDTFYG